MATVYLLRGTSGRHYIGATENLQARLARHNSGQVHSSRRLGLPLTLVASRNYDSMQEALSDERKLKRWKNPSKVELFLRGG